jgi:hypothetical protein
VLTFVKFGDARRREIERVAVVEREARERCGSALAHVTVEDRIGPAMIEALGVAKQSGVTVALHRIEDGAYLGLDARKIIVAALGERLERFGERGSVFDDDAHGCS